MRDIPALLDSLGIQIASTQRKGDGTEQYFAHCPYHFEGTRTDSIPDNWSINSETGRHKCWSCGFEGTVEWLVHKVAGVSLQQAREDTGFDTVLRDKVARLDAWDGARPHDPVPMDEARIKMFDTTIPSWALEKRRLTQQACEDFGVRWAEEFWHRDKVYPMCWITPIRDSKTNKILGMQVKQESGDRFFRNLPADVRKASTLFGHHLIHGRTALVESPLDAVYLHGLGVSAVASMGAEVSAQQMEILIERADEIVIALDDDAAGHKATRRLLGLDRGAVDYSRRIRISVVDYEAEALGAKDPGECTPKVAKDLIRYAKSSVGYQLHDMGGVL